MASTRESITKNNVRSAREAAKRFPEHKQLCEKFIKSFENTGEEADGRYGFKKYMKLLQRAAGRDLETIYIDLDDVKSFCSQEMRDPDAELTEAVSVPKVQLQQSIDLLPRDIESNTLRYMKYFYEACSAEMPETDALQSSERAEFAKDTVAKWRERMADQHKTSGLPTQASPIPPRLKNSIDVRFKPRSDSKTLMLREISASSVGALVQIDCLVTRVSSVKPKIEVVTYHCETCGAEVFQSVEGDRYTPLKECPSEKCKTNKVTGKLRTNIRTCAFAKYQEMRVQEMSEHVPVGGVPRALNVVLSGDLTRTVLPGDAISLTGVYMPYELPWILARKQGTTQQMYIDAHFIRKHKRGYNEQEQNEHELTQMVEEQQRQQNLYESAAKSIAPEIFGLLDVKKALLLVLIGSFTKTMKDGMKIRGDIHTLFMGDPGVAKSQLLKQVVHIAPRSVYTTGKGSSGVGLTASVVRDRMTGEVTLEGGALVLADMGICCIDEFDKMEESDRTAIHEVMEQQSVSIAKSGITTTLNCRTTVLAAANPQYGRYNPAKSPVENIDLPAALLSRFDLLFLLLDTVDQDKDKMLAQHVCKVHSTYHQQQTNSEVKTGKESQGEAASSGGCGDVLNLGFKPFDSNFMRTYIRKARSYEPLIEDSLQRDIVDAYVSMRVDEKQGDIDSRKSYTTPRTLLAILRLSQAHARARFSERVERQDFDEAMRLMKASKESVELSAPAKRGQSPLDIVYDIIANLSRRHDGEGWVDLAHVVSMAGLKALNREQVQEAVENWESLSVLCMSPEKDKVKFLVPA